MYVKLSGGCADYKECTVVIDNTSVDLGYIGHSTARGLLESLENTVSELKRFLGIPEVEEPTVVIHMDEDCLDYVQTSCDMTVIVSDPHSDVGHRINPEGRNAFIYKTGCEPLERETIDQWKKLV